MNEKSNGSQLLHRLANVLAVIISCAVIVLAVLQLTNVWQTAVNVCIPLMGLEMLLQTYSQWERSRKTAYFTLFAAIFVFICAAVVFFLP